MWVVMEYMVGFFRVIERSKWRSDTYSNACSDRVFGPKQPWSCSHSGDFKDKMKRGVGLATHPSKINHSCTRLMNACH